MLADDAHIAVLEVGDEDVTVQRLALSPDGSILAAGTSFGTLHLWDMATYQELVTIDAHDPGLDAMAFSPDGRLLVTSGYDSMVRLWGVREGSEN
jgi:WD40 repeat protein